MLLIPSGIISNKSPSNLILNYFSFTSWMLHLSEDMSLTVHVTCLDMCLAGPCRNMQAIPIHGYTHVQMRVFKERLWIQSKFLGKKWLHKWGCSSWNVMCWINCSSGSVSICMKTQVLSVCWTFLCVNTMPWRKDIIKDLRKATVDAHQSWRVLR